MRSKYISISILTASLLATVSCGKKFLDKKPIATSIDVTYYQNNAQLITGVNAAYDPLNWYQADARSSSTPVFEFIWGDICSDDATGGGDATGDTRYGALGDFQGTVNTPQLLAVWRNQYVGVRRANIIIEKAPTAQYASAAIKKRVIAEAKFLRAYYHFYLFRMFGPVPYVTKQLQTGEFEQSRPTEDAFFANLIADLKEAAADLPNKYTGTDLGRATKTAALGYLARVYMYKGNEWTNVLSTAEAVIADSTNSGKKLDRTVPYENLHSVSTEYGPESVFEIGGTLAGNNEQDRLNEGTYFNKITGPRGLLKTQGYGLISPSQDLIDFFNTQSPGDPRRKATMALPGDVVYGETIKLDPAGAVNAKGYIRKYVEDAAIAVQTQGPSNIRLLRMGDVYLMAAEAAARLGGNNEAKARLYLNLVRDRAKVARVADAVVGDALLNAILVERRLELALEGQRFFDLIRQDKLKPDLHLAQKTFSDLKETEGRSFDEKKHKVFPIPQTEIDLSKGKIQQNPNY